MLQEFYQKYLEASANLYEESKKSIIADLKAHNGVCVLNPEDDEFVSVTYDGGNHPEYASNAFSDVHKVWLEEDDQIYLAVEDTDEYYFDCIQYDEAYFVAMALQNHKWGWTEEEKC